MMKLPLRVAVADDEPRMQAYYGEILPTLGHQVLCTVGTGEDLVSACRQSRPDLVIADIKMPDMDGIDAARAICREEPLPVILVSAYHEPDLLARASDSHVLAYLVKPIKQADLEAAITLAMNRFDQWSALHREAGELRQALEDRKTIEKAKGVLMKRANLDEPEAFRRLQKLARDNNQKLAEVARNLLAADAAFG